MNEGQIFVSCDSTTPILQDCVLPAARGVVDRDVHDLPVLAKQEGRLPVQMQRWHGLLALENVEPPPLFRLLRLRRLAVLDDDTVENVCVFEELS